MSKGKQTPDISNISQIVDNIDINVLRRRVAELEKHNVALQLTIDKFTSELSKKDEEISHLQSMLGASVPLLHVPNLSQAVSDEEIIAEQQLDRLKQKAKTTELTLEEVKKFDLLVKNKRLAQGASTSNGEYKDVTNSSLNKKKLLTLAATTIPEDRSANIAEDNDGE
jgi:vacuolar-type H+-ATPase subunit I/STV1